MGFEVETRIVLRCDNGCGAEVEYDDDDFCENLADVELPEGWARDYDNGESIFGYVCDTCIEEFKAVYAAEGGY